MVVGGFHGDHGEVEWGEFGGGGGDGNAEGVFPVADGFDGEAVAADVVGVGAAEEMHVASGADKASAVVTAKGAGAEDADDGLGGEGGGHLLARGFRVFRPG